MPDPRWNIPADVRRRIIDSMNRSVFGTPESQRDLAGQVEQIGKRELAFRMAGTRDTKSRAYKSARDSISRWSRGTRAPSARSLDRVAGASRSHRADQIRDTGRMSFAFVATFQTSRSDWKGAAKGELSGSALGAFLNFLESGESEAAARAATRAYGPDFAPFVTGIKDVQEFRLRDQGQQ